MSATSEIIEIIITDDHPIYCDGLSLIIGKHHKSRLKITGVAHSGKELLMLLQNQVPHVLLLDIQMPEMNGIEVTRTITATYPSVKVIALSSFNESWAVLEMVKAGAKGYLLKNVNKDELLEAIETVHAGDTYFTPEMQSHLEIHIDSDETKPIKDILSDREKEVIQLLCQGKTNKEIANALSISRRTVEGHRNKISQKIHARHSMEIMQYAVKHGIYKVS
jgi:DNA-binding NarL/FixJ family response regulator